MATADLDTDYQYSTRSLNYPTMAGYLPIYTQRGRLYYLPPERSGSSPSDPVPPADFPTLFRPRPRRPQRIHIARVRLAPSDSPGAKSRSYRKSTTTLIAEKFNLAVSKESAKRFLRSFISSPSAPKPSDPPAPPDDSRPGTSEHPRPDEQATALPGASPLRRSTSARGAPSGRRRAPPNFRHSLAGPIPGAASSSRMSLTSTLNPPSTSGMRVTSPGRPLRSGSLTRHSSSESTSHRRTTSKIESEEKPIAAGNGVSVFISLTEPVLFLQGFENTDSNGRGTAMLRGSLRLKVTKAAKIKAVTLRFKGKAITKWPEGIPPKKTEFEETDSIMSHTWPFFNAQFPMAEQGPGTDHFELFAHKPSVASSITSHSHDGPLSLHKSRASFDIRRISPSNTGSGLTRSDQKRLSLQVNKSRSFSKDEAAAKPGHSGPSISQKGYRTFQPGEYFYNFELPLDSHLPETLAVDLGSVNYALEAEVARAGAFRANLVGTKPVVLIRAPAEGSLEQVEPIAISRNWEDQLHYDIVISGKSFPLGAQVPIAFKLTPLAKVVCHRIKVYVTENIEYWAHNKRVHRMEPTRKIQLFEKRSDAPAVSAYPGSTMRVLSGGGLNYDERQRAAMGEYVQQGPQSSNLLGNLDSDGGQAAGPTEMEFSVQLPTCRELHSPESRSHRLHFDTTYQNIQVHHWIKIVMRLSRPDVREPTKRRHFEISIDSPFHILSCRAVQANLALPAYSSENYDAPISLPNLATCGCGGAAALSANHGPGWMAQASSRSTAVHRRRDPSPPSASPSQPSSGWTTARNSGIYTGTPAAGSSIVLPRPEAAHIPTTIADPAAYSPPTTTTAISPDTPSSPPSDAPASSPTAARHAGDPSNPARPVHLIRTPSFNPPPFSLADADPPPALLTPPPNYDAIIDNPTTGLADYFQRLTDTYAAAESGSEDEGAPVGTTAGRRRHRVEVPLTPGGRSSRSMDGMRPWERPAAPVLRGAEAFQEEDVSPGS